MLISNCVRCGETVGQDTEETPIFHIAISQLNKKDIGCKKCNFRTIVLCDECQDQLWRWIYCRNGDESM